MTSLRTCEMSSIELKTTIMAVLSSEEVKLIKPRLTCKHVMEVVKKISFYETDEIIKAIKELSMTGKLKLGRTPPGAMYNFNSKGRVKFEKRSIYLVR